MHNLSNSKRIPCDKSQGILSLELKETLKKTFKLHRYGKTNNIGKFIGGCVYIHKSELKRIGMPCVANIVSHAPPNTHYEVLKIRLTHGTVTSVSLINSPDWTTSNEPIIDGCLKISIDNDSNVTINQCSVRKNNALIYHHKWLFVSEDSNLFDLHHSMLRSIEWLSISSKTNLNKSKIGGVNFWDNWLFENNISPRIPQELKPQIVT